MTVIYNDDDLQPNKIDTPFEQVAWTDIKEYRLSAAWLADIVIFERGAERRLLKNIYGSLSNALSKPIGDKILEAELIE